MSHKGGKMECVRLKINEHMTLVGEEILCVLDNQQRGADVCSVTLNVRVFVLERLCAAAQFMCDLFQREMEPETLLDKQNELLDIACDMDIDLHTAEHHRETSTVSTELSSKIHSALSEEQREMDRGLLDARMQPVVKLYRIDLLHVPVCKEEVSPEEEQGSSLVQEEPKPPHIKEEQEEPQAPHIKEEQEDLLERSEDAGGSTLTLLAVKSEDDDKNRETEPVAGTSTEHMKTQAGVEDCGLSQPTSDDQLLSSHCSESDSEDSDEWEETRGDQLALNTLKSHKTQNVDLKSSEQTDGMRSHTGKKSFSCTECGKMFKGKGDLKRHTMFHKGEKPFSCTVCCKCFTQAGNLKKHMRTHTGEKPYTCTVCGKGCVNTSNLKIHMRTHTGEKPISCKVCGKGFAHMSNLKSHTMTHTGEKPFSCTVCGHGCVSRSNLKTHMRAHTGEKPFCCTVCGKGFAQFNNLKIHTRIHTGEKPFSCTVCGKVFTQTSNLKKHMRTHTLGKPSV